MRTLSLVVALALAAPAWAGIELSEKYPQENQPVTLTLTTANGAPAGGVTVTAAYGPGSELLWEKEIGSTDSTGQLSWVPAEAGLVALSAEAPGAEGPETLSSTISVKFSAPPMLGILVMVVAGFILYGGVIHGFRRLTKPVPSFPPDT